MTTRQVILGPLADQDLVEIFNFIYARNAAASSRFLAAVAECFKELASSPELGFAKEFRTRHLTGIRRWRVKGFENYQVFYRVMPQRIEVIRVLHGVRDIQSLFDDNR